MYTNTKRTHHHLWQGRASTKQCAYSLHTAANLIILSNSLTVIKSSIIYHPLDGPWCMCVLSLDTAGWFMLDLIDC